MLKLPVKSEINSKTKFLIQFFDTFQNAKHEISNKSIEKTQFYNKF